MRGDEQRVVDSFCAWLESDGWTVRREVDWADVVAERGSQTMYAEAKGRTTSPGLDIDTAYGQLLRRMHHDGEGDVYALVVPESTVPHALRVPERIRHLLGIKVFGVDEHGDVHRQS